MSNSLSSTALIVWNGWSILTGVLSGHSIGNNAFTVGWGMHMKGFGGRFIQIENNILVLLLYISLLCTLAYPQFSSIKSLFTNETILWWLHSPNSYGKANLLWYYNSLRQKMHISMSSVFIITHSCEFMWSLVSDLNLIVSVLTSDEPLLSNHLIQTFDFVLCVYDPTVGNLATWNNLVLFYNAISLSSWGMFG